MLSGKTIIVKIIGEGLYLGELSVSILILPKTFILQNFKNSKNKNSLKKIKSKSKNSTQKIIDTIIYCNNRGLYYQGSYKKGVYKL